MTAQLLSSELANLIQESKRKNNDLRQAAEKSLEDLKGLQNVSEQKIGEALSQRINFVNPFIVACGSKNAKFTSIAIVCLQRLVVTRALPGSKLNQALEALMQASSAGLDVQLKILQALPSLLQNYAEDLKGDLLVTTINICFILQSSKNAIVNNTSAATLQQLVVSIFDKVVDEDRNLSPADKRGAPQDGSSLSPAALDAYRIFNDICLLTENQRPEFLRYSALSRTFGLELVESVITNHATIFASHPEQTAILRNRVFPLILSALKGKTSFAISVRVFRILYTILRRHVQVLPDECADALNALIQLLDQEGLVWKKALCMEVFRGVFAEPVLVRRIFALYDAQDSRKDVMRPLTGTLVRLSTEKPAIIGLGHQSTMPTSVMATGSGGSTDQAMLEATGVAGIISGSGSSETVNTGISMQWSVLRVPCIDQLDKTESPVVPESYIYCLILNCLSSLSDGLAKFILPMTVANQGRSKRKDTKQSEPSDSTQPEEGSSPDVKAGLRRTSSFKKNPAPINPRGLNEHPLAAEIQTCSAIVEDCWPAILATCSTFLNASLDSEFYHGLVRAFQRFAHVAGLLQLSTPRHAFLTTLGKAAVPSSVLTASSRQPSSATPTEAAAGVFSNARALLSADTLTPSSPTVERQPKPSFDGTTSTLTTRNLLCLRALLNLGIALGPTLDTAWPIIFETLQQADFVLFASGRSASRNSSSMNRGHEGESEQTSLMSNFSAEVRSVETAASRLVESTFDFPNAAFHEVIRAVCGLLPEGFISSNQDADSNALTPSTQETSTPAMKTRSFAKRAPNSSVQEDSFALAKLRDLASNNLDRLLEFPPEESGWDILTEKLEAIIHATTVNAPVRVRAVETLAVLVQECVSGLTDVTAEKAAEVQTRVLDNLHQAHRGLYAEEHEGTVANNSTAIEIHRIVLETLTAVIETCGDSLTAGWKTIFVILDSAFLPEHEKFHETSTPHSVRLGTRSPKLVRSSFVSLQLICSDFLSALPNQCFLLLIASMHRFCSQDSDLNIALTSLTFFWALSDFLHDRTKTISQLSAVVKDASIPHLEKVATHELKSGADSALWMLLLLRLADIAADARSELRNSAIQTLFRIFDAYGERLEADGWLVCIDSIVLSLLTALIRQLGEHHGQDSSDNEEETEWYGTAVVVMDSMSQLFSTYLDVLVRSTEYNRLWKDLHCHLSSMLSLQNPELNTAVYQGLTRILNHGRENGKALLGKTAIDCTWDLWVAHVPHVRSTSVNNQKCLQVYVATLQQLYGYVEGDIDVDRVVKMLDGLNEAVRLESASGYANDIENATELQTQVMACYIMIRSEVDGVPSVMIRHVAELVSLPFRAEVQPTPGSRRTFIAISKTCMKFLSSLCCEHAEDRRVYTSGAMASALEALAKSISLKYNYRIATKSQQPWQEATNAVLQITSKATSSLAHLNLAKPQLLELWSSMVKILNHVLEAESNMTTNNTVPDGDQFLRDERFDISASLRLYEMIVPLLGSSTFTATHRDDFVRHLYRASIIHQNRIAENAALEKTFEIRAGPLVGSTLLIPPVARSRMAYVALQQLFRLVSADRAFSKEEDTTEAPITSFAKDDEPEMYGRLAQAAGPWLLLRCAVTLRSYIADQPIRGKMPQPLSQRKELVWVLEALIRLESNEAAYGSSPNPGAGSKAHLVQLYPLLVRALGAGGDDKVESLLKHALEVIGTERLGSVRG